jgi:hypothetical protein
MGAIWGLVESEHGGLEAKGSRPMSGRFNGRVNTKNTDGFIEGARRVHAYFLLPGTNGSLLISRRNPLSRES